MAQPDRQDSYSIPPNVEIHPDDPVFDSANYHSTNTQELLGLGIESTRVIGPLLGAVGAALGTTSGNGLEIAAAAAVTAAPFAPQIVRGAKTAAESVIGASAQIVEAARQTAAQTGQNLRQRFAEQVPVSTDTETEE